MPEKQVANPKAPIKPDENSYNDRDRLNDLLISMKHITYMYSLACQEASNNTLYKEMKELMAKSSAKQRACYDLMFENGWYMLEKQPENKIATTKQQFASQESQL